MQTECVRSVAGEPEKKWQAKHIYYTTVALTGLDFFKNLTKCANINKSSIFQQRLVWEEIFTSESTPPNDSIASILQSISSRIPIIFQIENRC